VTETIEVSLDRLRTIIAAFEVPEFSTDDVIRGYCGGFFSNTGTPAYYSFNAQFGKLLRSNEAALGIEHLLADQPIKDDRQHATSSSTWRRLNV